ncbi:MAG: ParM/StbA family protein [Desulfotomaculales bacterium]
MLIAVDVGYSHVKAISEEGRRALLPSVVAPYRELVLADLSRDGVGHVVEIKRPSGEVTKYFVGELAVREGQVPIFTLARDKYLLPEQDALLLAAARLLGTGQGTVLVAGLPVTDYRERKETLRRHLEALAAWVSVDGEKHVWVTFSRIVVYPQGAGALLTVPDLPEDGLVAVVDVGYKTTDYVTAQIVNGAVQPVSRLCGTVDCGVHQVLEAVAQEFQTRTGAPLDPVRAGEVAARGKVFFRGKEIDLAPAVAAARRDVARAIAGRVLAALGDRADFVRRIYLAGGGAQALPDLPAMFPVAEILPDPQWANAVGFLKAANV